MGRIGRDERLAGDESGGGDQDVHVSGRLPLLLEQRGDPGEQPCRFGSKLQDRQVLQEGIDAPELSFRIIRAIDPHEQFGHSEAGGGQVLASGEHLSELVSGAAPSC